MQLIDTLFSPLCHSLLQHILSIIKLPEDRLFGSSFATGMSKHCLIVTANMVEAEDLSDLVSESYGMKVHTYRDAEAAAEEASTGNAIDLAFLSIEYGAPAMSDLIQSLLSDGANIILIDGSASESNGPVGVLRRPYSSSDIGRIMAEFR
ncbi:MAG: hypothetical protein P8Y82_09455 [Methyloceanibacter sp.]